MEYVFLSYRCDFEADAFGRLLDRDDGIAQCIYHEASR